jgi:hypothetical protein
MWSLDTHVEAIELIIQKANSAEGKDLLLGIEPEERADAILERVFEEPSEGPLASVVRDLRYEFSNEAWEHVLRAAIDPLVREAEVLHTGGPDEQGADVVINYTRRGVNVRLISVRRSNQIEREAYEKRIS